MSNPKTPDKRNIKNANNMPKKEGSLPGFASLGIRAFSVATMRMTMAINTQTMISRSVVYK